MFLIDHDRAKELGVLLGTINLRPGYEDFIVPRIKENQRQILSIMALVAICHQTQQLKGRSEDGKPLRGNPYMTDRFANWMSKHPEQASPRYILGMDEKRLLEIMSDDGIADHSTLDRVTERLDLLKDTFRFFKSHCIGDILRLNGKKLLGDDGIYQYLKENFGRAFSADPLMKKASYFIWEMYLAGHWRDIQTEGYVPMVDYHKQRLFLRMGLIRPEEETVRGILQNREQCSAEDMEKIEGTLREMCVNAFNSAVKYSGKNIMEVTFMDWLIARNCCREEGPACTLPGCVYEVCDIPAMFEVNCGSRCLLESCCDKLTEYTSPKIDTDKY